MSAKRKVVGSTLGRGQKKISTRKHHFYFSLEILSQTDQSRPPPPAPGPAPALDSLCRCDTFQKETTTLNFVDRFSLSFRSRRFPTPYSYSARGTEKASKKRVQSITRFEPRTFGLPRVKRTTVQLPPTPPKKWKEIMSEWLWCGW